MKHVLVLLIAAMVGCGGPPPVLQDAGDLEAGVAEASDQDGEASVSSSEAGDENGSLWTTCSGPEDGCGNKWCFPNCNNQTNPYTGPTTSGAGGGGGQPAM
jgi:hypothetical protein